MPMLHVLSSEEGDKRIQWETDNQKDLDKAKKVFKEKLKAGFSAFGYLAGETAGRLIKEFSEEFDRILMIPPIGGG